MAPGRVTIQYFSDVLCVWAYVGQVRVDELEAHFASDVLVDCHFINVFGNARDKLSARWVDQGGLSAYAERVREIVARFEHVTVHPDVWTRVAPTSSLGCQLLLAAAKLLGDGVLFRELTRAMRQAFFRDGVDISQRAAQLEVAKQSGLPLPELEAHLATGRAHAELARGLDLAREYGVTVSPTYVFNEGRQRLNGNVGYRVIEANVRELLREPELAHSWC